MLLSIENNFEIGSLKGFTYSIFDIKGVTIERGYYDVSEKI